MTKCNTEVRGALSLSVIPGVGITMLMANACASHRGTHIIACFHFVGSCKYCSHSVDEAETLPAPSDMLSSWHHGVFSLRVIQARLIHG